LTTTTPVFNNVANTTSAVKTMPLIGILKTNTNTDLIKYRPKSKCLVFKEGDPLVIGYGIDKPLDGYGSDDNECISDEEVDEESEDDFDDPMLYSSDDKDLRELTQNNTKFNSNFANLSVNNSIDNKVKQIVNQVIDSQDSTDNCVNSSPIISNGSDVHQHQIVVGNSTGSTEQTIPDVCEKLVKNGFNETFGSIDNCINNCENTSQTPDSSASDVTPMSTSSDSYSSSDEKEDSQTIGMKYKIQITYYYF